LTIFIRGLAWRLYARDADKAHEIVPCFASDTNGGAELACDISDTLRV
jgi:hypothetical protein